MNNEVFQFGGREQARLLALCEHWVLFVCSFSSPGVAPAASSHVYIGQYAADTQCGAFTLLWRCLSVEISHVQFLQTPASLI